ncbi:hypothetical protein M8542_14755 [Amycolatopsis sp. OK19-0408]|uniref:Uncharacterized protein n=1 Tax=Amycolatopsis iheyensis TaxID=2945988 RepID=A0A9X2N8P8_9PSEU|nr:hypothetical protein [Amycolatopsis iheyensis]MCR6484079.1 hypothetical protein [Amycolatopsis iheyensis]
MSVDGPGFHVDVDVLDNAAEGIAQSVHDQETFELRGLCGDAGLYGHAGVHSALADYCARWSAGLDTLVEDAGMIGDCLKRTSDAYRGIDEASARRLPADPGTAAIGD